VGSLSIYQKMIEKYGQETQKNKTKGPIEGLTPNSRLIRNASDAKKIKIDEQKNNIRIAKSRENVKRKINEENSKKLSPMTKIAYALNNKSRIKNNSLNKKTQKPKLNIKQKQNIIGTSRGIGDAHSNSNHMLLLKEVYNNKRLENMISELIHKQKNSIVNEIKNFIN
jgi:hypothetical protein